MICVDIDPRNGVTREMFEAKVGQLPPTMTVTAAWIRSTKNTTLFSSVAMAGRCWCCRSVQ
jgi:hypothetical protein